MFPEEAQAEVSIDEFKREAVALLRSSHASITEVSAEMVIGPSLLSRWAREFEESDGSE